MNFNTPLRNLLFLSIILFGYQTTTAQCPSDLIITPSSYTCNPATQTYDVMFTVRAAEAVVGGSWYSSTLSADYGTLIPACQQGPYDAGNPACADNNPADWIWVCGCDGNTYTSNFVQDFVHCYNLAIALDGPCDGTYTVKYTLTGVPIGQDVTISANVLIALSLPDVFNQGCPYTLTIPAQPGPGSAAGIIGTTTVCGGSVQTYTSGFASGATSYQWTVPQGAQITSGQGTKVITVKWGNTSGSVCVTAQNNCGSSTATCKNVTVSPGPIVNLSTGAISCGASSVTLDAGNPGSTYHWSTGATTQTISAGSNGTYRVTVTQNGCTSVDSVFVKIQPPVQVTNVSSTGLSGSFQVSGGLPETNGSNYGSVVMALQGNATVKATLMTAPFTQNSTVSFTAPQAGTYQVVVTDAGGCSGGATVVVSGGGQFSSPPCIEWQNTYGGSNQDLINAMQITSDGGFILAAVSTSNDGSLSSNYGGKDAWVIKLDSTGIIEWQKALGGSGNDGAISIKQTSDGGFIMAGSTASNDHDVSGNHGSSDLWVVKFNATGAIEWQKVLGGNADDSGNDIIQTADGGFIIGGQSQSNDGDVTGNHGGIDMWVVKLNNSGDILWQKSLGGSGEEQALGIQETGNGGVIATGYTNSNDGDVSGNHGNKDCWVVKINSLGTIEWQKTLGGTKDEIGDEIIKTADGGTIIAGYSDSDDGNVSGNHGFVDCWVIKLDSTGMLQWQKSLGGSKNDFGNEIIQLSDGSYIMCGTSNSNDGDLSINYGGLDFWVIKLSPDGNKEWQKTLGGSNLDGFGIKIKSTLNGGFVLAGNTESNDGDISNNHGVYDIWAAKLKDCSCTPSITPSTPITLCYGDSITLKTPATTTGATYQWQKDGANINGATSATYTATAGGNYTLIITQPGCTATSTPVTVSVLPQIQVNNIKTNALTGSFVVTGGHPMVDGSNYNAVTMALQSNSGITATLSTAPFTHNQTVSFTVPQTGAYVVTVTDNSGCTGTTMVAVTGGITPGCDRSVDSLVLVALYDSTSGPGWIHQDNWKVAGKVLGMWYGVHTNSQSCVLYLDLDGKVDNDYPNGGNYGGNNLVGTVPAVIGNLQNIERLYLSNNQLKGNIPKALGKLTTLTDLFMYNNQLTGSIPAELNALYNLVNLDFYINQLSGPLPKELGLGSLYNLRGFYLSRNQLSGPIPKELNSLKELRQLYLGDNKFTGNISNVSMPNLEQLFVYSNQLSGPLPTNLQTPNLKYLWIANNQLSGTIPDFNLPKLISLGLDKNRFSGTVPKFTGTSLKGMAINDNRLTFSGMLYHANKNYPDGISYAPQDSIYSDTLIVRYAGQPLTIDLGIDASVPDNNYDWVKNDFYWTPPAPNDYHSNKLIFNSLTVDDAGTYYVQVTNFGAQSLILYSRAIRIQVDCAGIPAPAISGPTTLCTGSATLSVSGNYPIAPQWSGGQNGNAIAINGPGVYSVTVTDAYGCTNSNSITVAGGSTATPPAISGPGALCTGTATLSVSGSFSVLPHWSTGTDGLSTSIGGPGTYTVTITDAGGCTATNTKQVMAGSPLPVPTITGPTALCSGLATLQVNSNYPNPPKWSNGQSGLSITVNTPDVYSVTVTDAGGCTNSNSQTVGPTVQPPVPVISGPTALCSGTAALSVAGNYTKWAWSNNQTTPGITVHTTGTYSVTVTDTNGCTGTTSDNISLTAQAPTPSISGSTVLCTGATIALGVNGGPYSIYQWSNNATTATISVNMPGNYGVTVSNSAGCTGAASQNVQHGTSLQPTISGPTAICTGSISLDAGVGYSSYQWSDGQTTQKITVSAAGTYTVTVTSSGCSGTAVLQVKAGQIAAPPAISGNSFICSGNPVALNAGAGYAAYLWSDNTTGQQITVSAAGVYSVTVSNADGCTASGSKTIGPGTTPMPTLSGLPVICELDAAKVKVTQLFSTYQWSGGQTTQEVSLNVTGTYTVTVSNPDGCTAATTTAVTFSNPIDENLGPDLNVCVIPAAGLVLDAGAASAYQWSTGSGQSTIIVHQPGTYAVTVTNPKGCKSADTILVNLKAPILVDRDTVLCPGEQIIFCGAVIDKPGMAKCKFTTIDGCDSTITLHVQAFDPAQFNALPDSILLPSLTSSINIKVTANDVHPSSYTLKILHAPAHGTVTPLNANEVQYTLTDPDFYGLDSLEYGLCPPANCPDACASAWASVRVQAGSIDAAIGRIPNVFTPNEDNANDEFNPYKVLTENGIVVEEFSLDIVNRWGEAVFHSAYEGWNGRQGGHDLPLGTYYYRMRIVSGKTYLRTGAVNLLR
jgi:gliding motility-associated-like protein